VKRCARALLKYAYQESLCRPVRTMSTWRSEDDENDRDVSMWPLHSPCFDVDATAGVSLVQDFSDESPHERARYIVLDGGKGGDGDGGVLPLALPLVHFLF
jgi:hypothetical protein